MNDPIFSIVVACLFMLIVVPPVLPIHGYGTSIENIVYVDPSMSPGEIQDKLSSISAGTTVIFEPGVYHGGGFIVSGVENVSIIGYGSVFMADNGTDFFFDLGNAGGNIGLCGFVFIGPVEKALIVHNLGGAVLRDLVVVNATYALYFTSVSSILVENASITDIELVGIHVTSAGYVEIIDTSIDGGENGVYVGDASNIYIYNSTISGSQIGLNIANSDVEVIYSVIEDNIIGVKAVNSGSLRMYFNRFMDNGQHVVLNYVSSSALTSDGEIDYMFNGRSFSGVIGNYWSGYQCSDTDGDGVGEAPLTLYTDPYTNTVFKDPAPICPSYIARAVRISFINPDKLLVETPVSNTSIRWRNNTELNVSTIATAKYTIYHPDLGVLDLSWPAKLELVNISLLEPVEGVRIASTSRIMNYTVEGDTIRVSLAENGYIALAVEDMEITLVEKGDETIVPYMNFWMYNNTVWGAASIGDPVEVIIHLQKLPLPEPAILPITVLAALLILLVFRRTYYHGN